jgi:hypothetical protein
MYFPKSQIIPNIYTNGNELVYESNPRQFYIGYYHILSNGKIFSGKLPNDGNPVALKFPESSTFKEPTIVDAPSTNEDAYEVDYTSTVYDDIRNNSGTPPSPSSLIEPKSIPPTPSYPAFTRYFVKKTNELRYIEIDKPTFDKIVSKDKQYNWAIYKPFTIYWTTSGNSIQEVTQINKNIVALEEKRQKLYGLTNYFKNYSEFFV